MYCCFQAIKIKMAFLHYVYIGISVVSMLSDLYGISSSKQMNLPKFIHSHTNIQLCTLCKLSNIDFFNIHIYIKTSVNVNRYF